MKTKLMTGRQSWALTLILAATMLIAGRASAVDVDTLAKNCASCHGKDGASSESTIPSIGGISDFYMIDTMAVYRDQARPCVEAEHLDGPDKGKKTDMCKIAAELDEKEIEALAGYYSARPFVRAKQDFDAGKAATGQAVHERNCEKCHEDGGASAADDAGILAGQWTPYLRQVFEHYDTGKREMPEKMEPKYEKLDAAEKEALLHYYASLQ